MKKILFFTTSMCITFASFAQPGGPCCSILEINYKDKNVIARDRLTGVAFKFPLSDEIAAVKTTKSDRVEVDKPALKVIRVNGVSTSSLLKKYEDLDDLKFDMAAVPGAKYSLTVLSQLPKFHHDSVDAIQNILYAHNASEKITMRCGPDLVSELSDPHAPQVPIEAVDDLAFVVWKKPGEHAVLVLDILSRTSGTFESGSLKGQMNLGENAAARPNTGNGDKWDSKGNNLPGNTGRLLMDYPKGTTWKINIYTMEDKYIRSFDNTNSTGSFTLSPGEYRIKLNNVTLLNVPVRKGEDTRLRCGVLNIVSDTDWRLSDESGKTYYISGKKADKLLLPVGTYSLKLGGASQPVIVKNGETEER